MTNDMDANIVYDYLKNNYEQLTTSQKMIGEYVLENYREVAFMSAIELAEKVNVSDATIIRFSRSVGFHGFTEFRNYLKDSILNFDPPHIRLMKNYDTLSQDNNAVMDVGKTDLKNLEHFLLNLDAKKIDLAVDTISQAHTIYMFGTRNSGIIVDFLSFHLRRMGYKIIQITQSGAVTHEKIINITDNDLLITCSLPRYSKPTYQATVYAKSKNAKVMTITDHNISAISAKSDIVFALEIENSSYFNSHVVPMELCNILIMSLLVKNKDEIYKKLKENVQGMDIFDINL
jgi:DNA-binding MurR/RpiR family transcriptional regulator